MQGFTNSLRFQTRLYDCENRVRRVLFTVTELVGWEHSMKNELILAKYTGAKKTSAAIHLTEVLTQFGLEELLQTRFKLV